MVRICVVLVACLMLSGCVTAKYNAETKEISYNRFGSQELGGVEIILADGSSISFEKQKAEDALLRAVAALLLTKGVSP